jgi:15-cis-phytoene synthase
MDLYLKNALAVSRVTTLNYSTSFSMGIKALNKRFRAPIYAIYGFVRYADEIVDTLYEHDQKAMFDAFEEETFKAIEQKVSTNPILHSFQWAVNRFDINREYIDGFLYSMRLDLKQSEYNREEFEKYVYGSAEVVGLMCLKVFCMDNPPLFTSLIPSARALGSAFQKVNFLRDLKDDFVIRGRQYFPGVDFNNFDEVTKSALIEDIKRDFDLSLDGIRRLPFAVRLGVFLAYSYYQALLIKVEKAPAATITQKRYRVSNRRKLWIFMGCILKNPFIGKN